MVRVLSKSLVPKVTLNPDGQSFVKEFVAKGHYILIQMVREFGAKGYYILIQMVKALSSFVPKLVFGTKICQCISRYKWAFLSL